MPGHDAPRYNIDSVVTRSIIAPQIMVTRGDTSVLIHFLIFEHIPRNRSVLMIKQIK